MKSQKSKGAILIVTLLFLILISALTMQLMKHMNVHTYFASSVVKRDKAQMLCIGGINLAIAQLTEHKSKKFIEDLTSKYGNDQKKIDAEKDKKFLSNVFSNLNQWQVFKLTKKEDGIDGEVKFAITSESGKININKAFDFQNGDFIPEIKPHLESLMLKSEVNLNRGEITIRLKEYLRKRKLPLDDVSEILAVEGFSKLQLFYDPPQGTSGEEKGQRQSVAIGDLFTTWGDGKINPMFLSDSMRFLFGFRRSEFDDSEKMKSTFEKVADSFSRDYTSDWHSHWHLLQPVFGKELPPPGLAQKSKILSQEFDPKVYTVISCGKVLGVEQRVQIVLEASEQKEKKERDLFKIVRMYWL